MPLLPGGVAGGTTLSRSIGNFRTGDGVLPLPHIKQVLLPPSGGRLVLASDGVWSQVGLEPLRAMLRAPLAKAAHGVLKAAAGQDSGVDASIVVCDVLPPGQSFQEVCTSQHAPAGGPSGSSSSDGGGGATRQALLRMLRLGRGKRSGSKAQQRSAVAPAPGPAVPKLLADVDTADLLGLLPTVSRCSSGSSGSSGGSDAAFSRSGQGPIHDIWFSEALGAQVLATMVSPPCLLCAAPGRVVILCGQLRLEFVRCLGLRAGVAA